jgi:hypothetical protein
MLTGVVIGFIVLGWNLLLGLTHRTVISMPIRVIRMLAIGADAPSTLNRVAKRLLIATKYRSSPQNATAHSD